MSKKNTNPYNPSCKYHAIFDAWGKAKGQTISKQELVDQGFSIHDVTVVLSPREDGASKGDIRGNASAQGHKYFAKIVGAGRAKRFRRCWRKVEIEPLARVKKADSVSAKKTAKKTVKKTVKAKQDTTVTA